MMNIFETHAHYDDAVFDEDREALLNSFPKAGIGRVINVSSSVDSLKKVYELVQSYPFIYGAAGLHPDEIGGLDDEVFEYIEKLCLLPKTVAVGEVGLDYHWNTENKEKQKECFARFIDLAKRTGLPLIIHSRDACADTLDMIKTFHVGDIGAVMHCYSYSKETAKELLDMGLYLGIGGVITFKNAKKLVEALEYAPLSSVLLETDCPYLAPTPHRGERNSSLYLELVAKRIAEIKETTPEEVAETSYENALRLFKKVER